MSEWISVKDKKPKIGGRYFLAYRVNPITNLTYHYVYDIGRYWEDSKEFECAQNLSFPDTLHWMEIPDVPEDK